MSPSQFHEDHATRRELINGPRPPPLRISKESHTIQKSSSSSTSSSATSAVKHHTPPPPQRHPVIIYTHSPKVIRTEARDFMALVQKLTGMTRSDQEPTTSASAPPPEAKDRASAAADGSGDSAATPPAMKCGAGNEQVRSSASLVFNSPQNRFFSDIPLFTPNSSDFFCSPHAMYRYPDPVLPSPNMVGSISPSVMEFLKAYPEY